MERKDPTSVAVPQKKTISVIVDPAGNLSITVLKNNNVLNQLLSLRFYLIRKQKVLLIIIFDRMVCFFTEGVFTAIWKYATPPDGSVVEGRCFVGWLMWPADWCVRRFGPGIL